MSDIREEMKRQYKRAEENDIKIIEPSEEECFVGIIKEYQRKVDELQNRINKAVEDLEKTKELNDKHILARDNIVVHLDIDHIEYLLNILKGDNK